MSSSASKMRGIRCLYVSGLLALTILAALMMEMDAFSPLIATRRAAANAAFGDVGVGVGVGSSTGRQTKSVSSSSSRLFLSSSVSTEEKKTSSDDVVDEDEMDSGMTARGMFKRDRYVATNRFAVRKGREAKFEKRWATRKSRLATLEGFKYFHLMRRVSLNDDGTCAYVGGETDEEAQENYVSFTIWEKKSHFSSWRKGDAFKEAHGGTSIGAFLSTMVNSALVLRGAPRPAFYDGLFLESAAPGESAPKTVDGWRQVDADGVNTLPAECFVALEKFYISKDQAPAYEQLWAKRSATLSGLDGFVGFTLMRRDGQAKGHGMGEVSDDEPTYIAAAIFRDRPSFQKWYDEYQQRMESMPKEKTEATSKMWSGNRAPEKIFYEGTLVITSEDGA